MKNIFLTIFIILSFTNLKAETELEIKKEMDYTTEGNVIKLTKWTKTLGEA